MADIRKVVGLFACVPISQSIFIRQCNYNQTTKSVVGYQNRQ